LHGLWIFKISLILNFLVEGAPNCGVFQFGLGNRPTHVAHQTEYDWISDVDQSNRTP